MASYTNSLRLILPVTGTESGTWGDTINNKITSLVDSAVAGTAVVTIAGSDVTLTANNGATDEARNMVIQLTGSPGASRNVIVPAKSKIYYIRNSTANAQTVKTSGGSGVSVPSGRIMVLYCDGTDVVQAVNNIDSPALTGTPTAPTAAAGSNTTQVANTAYVTAERSTTATLTGKSLASLGVVSFASVATITSTSGTININWSASQNYKQNEPTGTITYTFTNPAGPCHLQLYIDSDGTSTAQTFNWPTLTWMGFPWTAVANKKAILSFWFDGTNYFATGVNQV